jgi:hypothetical protein
MLTLRFALNRQGKAKKTRTEFSGRHKRVCKKTKALFTAFTTPVA